MVSAAPQHAPRIALGDVIGANAVGSFAYNATLTLGTGALALPLLLAAAGGGGLGCGAGVLLLVAYGGFVGLVLAA